MGLVEVVPTGDEEAAIKAESQARMQFLAAKAAFWMRNGHGGLRQCSPDLDLMANFLDSPTDWQSIPPLKHVARTPFFDQSGKLVAQAGYNEATRTFLILPDGFGLGDTKPTQSSGEASWRRSGWCSMCFWARRAWPT